MIPLGVLAYRPPLASGGAFTFLQSSGTYTGSDPKTFAGQDLGTPMATRTIIACIASNPATDYGVITISGVTLTIDAYRKDTFTNSVIGHATVPLGATGDVVLNNTGIRTGIALYVHDGPVTVVDSDIFTSGGSGSLTMDAAAGDFIIANAYRPSGGVWGGAVKRHETQFVPYGDYFTGADLLATSGTPVTVTVTGDSHAMAAVTYRSA